jgi:uncharacterized protein (TIGR04255 family)
VRQDTLANPFTDEVLEQVPLANSPLETVLFQLKFPATISKLKRALTTDELQNALADEFPYGEKQQSMTMLLQPGQAPIPEPGPEVWNLHSADRKTTVSLNGDSVSVVTGAYQSRQLFLNQIKTVLSAVDRLATPPGASRIGLRYIDRVSMEEEGAQEWVQTLTQGAQGVLSSLDEQRMRQLRLFVQHVVYGWEDSTLMQARWGILPSGSIIDGSMAVRGERTWFFDIDTFIEAEIDFDVEAITERTHALAKRSYRFFRWMVPPAALERFSPGEPS